MENLKVAFQRKDQIKERTTLNQTLLDNSSYNIPNIFLSLKIKDSTPPNRS